MLSVRNIFIIFNIVIWGIAQPVLAADVKLQVLGEVRVSYDDNVTYTHLNPIHDVITSAVVGAGITAQGPRYNMDVLTNITRNNYSDNNNFDNTAFDTKINGQLEFSSRDHVVVTETFTHADQPRTFEDAFGRLNGRYSYDQNRFSVGYTRDLSSHLNSQWHYDQDFKFYSRRDLSDTSRHTVGALLGYSLDSANSVGVGYDFSERFYDPGRTIKINTVFGSYRHYFTKQLYADLKAGDDFVADPVGGDESHGMVEVKLTNDLDQNTRAGLSFRKGIGAESNSQNLFNSYRVMGTWARQLTQRWGCGGNGFFGEGDYKITQIRDRLMGLGMGVVYTITPHSKINLNYTYSETQSNRSARSYKQNYVQLGTQFLF